MRGLSRIVAGPLSAAAAEATHERILEAAADAFLEHWYDDVTIVERAPHREVLRHAAAVVTHAGHGTGIKALAAGVPVVALPLGRDQLDNAARVAHHGAGLRLKPKSSSDAIARAVRRVVEEPSFGASAERMAAAIAVETADDRAVKELEELASHSEVDNPGLATV